MESFNYLSVLIAKGDTDALWNRVAACGPDDNVTTSMRSIVVDTASYDWDCASVRGFRRADGERLAGIVLNNLQQEIVSDNLANPETSSTLLEVM